MLRELWVGAQDPRGSSCCCCQCRGGHTHSLRGLAALEAQEWVGRCVPVCQDSLGTKEHRRSTRLCLLP